MRALVVTVSVIALSACHPPVRSYPPPASGAEPVVVLERTPCRGLCPAYVVSAYANGRVVFEGRQHVSRIGTTVTRVDPAVVARLVATADDIDHAGYPDELTPSSPECADAITDQSGIVTTARTAGGTSTVTHNLGCRGFEGEAALVQFEDAVGAALGTAPLIGAR